MGSRRPLLLFGLISAFVVASLVTAVESRGTDASSLFAQHLRAYKGYVPASATATSVPSGLTISNIADNVGTYAGSQVPRYGKLEVSFDITDSSASNFYYPYDENPPSGIPPRTGITVDAAFTRDAFRTVVTQPAFYYQDFEYQTKGSRDWIYPTDNYSWKVRFAPPSEGTWQYRIVARDASGSTTSPVRTFTVGESSSKGFIRVSQSDPRYFEFTDGTYFPGLGYNMNFDRVSWNDPIQGNRANFERMSADGIQLVRVWLSQWSIFGSQDNPWRSPVRGSNYDSLTTTETNNIYPESDSSMFLKWSDDLSVWQGSPCMFLGWMKSAPAVKRDASYHVSVKYRMPNDLVSPNVAGQPYGLVAKLGGWLTDSRIASGTTWRQHQECVYPSALTRQANPGLRDNPITAYATTATSGWATLEGDFRTDSATIGNSDFLPFVYLALENVKGLDQGGNTAVAYIDYVQISENLGDGHFGPNIVSKPSMSHLQYMDQRYSYAFDRVLDLAEQYGIYFKLVLLEKNEFTQNSFDYTGNPVSYDSSNKFFYGNWRSMTKTRWLQEAYWRYVQARWGYSTSVHSWELLNEGDPYNGLHYTLADEFAKYMHQFTPDSHLVTTSFWHSFPKNEFWANPSFPNLDYADVHKYVPKDANAAEFYDSALAVQSLSSQIGAKTDGGVDKPTVRGETGFTDTGSQPSSYQIGNDTQGIWLHKFIWAGINPGGVIESYWYDQPHIYNSTQDHRNLYASYYAFVKDVPLNNGQYEDADVSVSTPNLRAWGQKDLANGRAHLWIDNATQTWGNVVGNPSAVVPQTGTIEVSGMPSGDYTISWFDTYAGMTSRTEHVSVDESGILRLVIESLATDTAVKVTR